MDETGFRIGCGIVHYVITLDKSKPLRFVDPDNRDYITSVANGYSRQIAERDIEAIHKEAVVKRARKTLSGTVAQKGGWMSVDQIRKSLTVVEETAIEKAEKALKRATRAEEIQ
ncbi:hypothetical protein HO173_009905 [Letharia columbiana]|uniref:Uncharacterized protein n=1 Tax=Letharia columbiana TaxID=112416 RepID=A0A8H6FNI7_9LECA|nr:uncharacterized protein HO173_009905 [Letharia columbiana]KAF6231822.1 hypothetical protein HO173_009905 [Letharia columbiana]